MSQGLTDSEMTMKEGLMPDGIRSSSSGVAAELVPPDVSTVSPSVGGPVAGPALPFPHAGTPTTRPPKTQGVQGSGSSSLSRRSSERFAPHAADGKVLVDEEVEPPGCCGQVSIRYPLA